MDDSRRSKKSKSPSKKGKDGAKASKPISSIEEREETEQELQQKPEGAEARPKPRSKSRDCLKKIFQKSSGSSSSKESSPENPLTSPLKKSWRKSKEQSRIRKVWDDEPASSDTLTSVSSEWTLSEMSMECVPEEGPMSMSQYLHASDSDSFAPDSDSLALDDDDDDGSSNPEARKKFAAQTRTKSFKDIGITTVAVIEIRPPFMDSDKLPEELAEELTAESAGGQIEKITEETAAKPVEETAANPVEETAAKPVEETAAKPVEETAAKPVEETAAKLVEETAAKPVEETAAKPVEETAAKPVEETAAKPVEETAAKPVEETAANPVEETAANPVEETAAKPVEETAAKPVKERAAKPVEETAAKPVEETAAKPVEETAAKPVEETAAKPVEETAAKPVEETAAKPVEETAAKPMEETAAKHVEETVAKTTEGTAAKPTEGTAANSPHGTAANSPHGASAKSPDGASAKSPDGASAKSPDGASAKSPDGVSAKSPDGVSAKSPDGVSANSPDGASANSSDGASAESPDGATAAASGGATAEAIAGATAKRTRTPKKQTWADSVSPNERSPLRTDIIPNYSPEKTWTIATVITPGPYTARRGVWVTAADDRITLESSEIIDEEWEGSSVTSRSGSLSKSDSLSKSPSLSPSPTEKKKKSPRKSKLTKPFSRLKEFISPKKLTSAELLQDLSAFATPLIGSDIAENMADSSDYSRPRPSSGTTALKGLLGSKSKSRNKSVEREDKDKDKDKKEKKSFFDQFRQRSKSDVSGLKRPAKKSSLPTDRSMDETALANTSLPNPPIIKTFGGSQEAITPMGQILEGQLKNFPEEERSRHKSGPSGYRDGGFMSKFRGRSNSETKKSPKRTLPTERSLSPPSSPRADRSGLSPLKFQSGEPRSAPPGVIKAAPFSDGKHEIIYKQNVIQKLCAPGATDHMDYDESGADNEQVIYAKFMHAHKCYDLIPTSAKLVIFDTQLNVKKAFFALIYNGVRAAPLWDSERQDYVGMLTITDFIHILNRIYRAPDVRMDELEDHKIQQWREMTADHQRPLVYISPDASLFEAVRTLIECHVHRLPVIDEETGNAIHILTHKRILRFLHIYIRELPQPSFMKSSIKDLGIGTYTNVITTTPESLLISALTLFMQHRISALPVVDSSSGEIVNIYSKFDVINLAADKSYNNLDVTVGTAIQNRPRENQSERVATCHRWETLGSVMEKIVKAEVHRLVIVDEQNHVEGIISLSDLLKYIVLRPMEQGTSAAAGDDVADVPLEAQEPQDLTPPELASLEQPSLGETDTLMTENPPESS